MNQRTADYVVIGAGSAGAALANRLTENGRYQVLLLEAGGETHPLSRVPVSFARFINRPGVNWLYASEPEPNTGGRNIPVPRGKMLGGSSAINGMVWVRGQRQDYDHWAQLGNRGWSWHDVLPLFKGIESYRGGDNELRGRGGPLKVTDIDESGPLYDSLFAAAESIGIPNNPDYNGADQEGIAMTQCSISGGFRMSTARVYLDPARARRNFRVDTGAHAQCLLFEGTRCVGVRYTMQGETYEARAAREVIVSAGSIASPQLLELSGIGQSERLKGLGITVKHELRGVGENLRDHWAPRLKWRVGRHGVTFNERARGLRGLGQGLLYITQRRGFLSHPASPMRAFIKSREGLDSPDAMLAIQPMLVTPDVKIAKEAGITVIAHQLRPESRGSIHIKTADASKPARDQLQFPRRARRPRMPRRRDARRAQTVRGARDGVARPGGIRTRTAGAVGRRPARLRRAHGRDRLSPGRHLQDGVGPERGGRRAAARARDRVLARGGCVDHADAHLGQYQRARDHDRREGRPHGAGGCGVTRSSC